MTARFATPTARSARRAPPTSLPVASVRRTRRTMDSRDVSLTERVRGVGGRKLRGGHRARRHAACAAGRARCVACASAARLKQVQHAAPPQVVARARFRNSLLRFRWMWWCEAAAASARAGRARGAHIEFRPERRPTRFNARQSRDTLAVPRREVPRIGA